jgi:hypothetical protein
VLLALAHQELEVSLKLNLRMFRVSISSSLVEFSLNNYNLNNSNQAFNLWDNQQAVEISDSNHNNLSYNLKEVCSAKLKPQTHPVLTNSNPLLVLAFSALKIREVVCLEEDQVVHPKINNLEFRPNLNPKILEVANRSADNRSKRAYLANNHSNSNYRINHSVNLQ